MLLIKKLVLAGIWALSSFLTVAVSFVFFSYRENMNLEAARTKQTIQQISLRNNSYQMYASLPRVLGSSTFLIKSADSIFELAKKISKGTPVMVQAEDYVKIARENGLNDEQLLMLLAIGRCESGLGKKMPENCYNPFGWGIHSQGTLCFDSWQDGFKKVTLGFKAKYIDKDLTSPEEIMEVYCPLSLEKGGPWAKCVKHYLDGVFNLDL